jgi:hypothetical protein
MDDSLDDPSGPAELGNVGVQEEEEDTTLPPTLARMFDAAVAGTSGGSGAGARPHRCLLYTSDAADDYS